MFQEILKAIGADRESIGRINKGLKWIGIILLFLILVGVLVEIVSSNGPNVASQSASVNSVQANDHKQLVPGTDKRVGFFSGAKPSTFFFWLAVAGIGVAGYIEPKEPKRDGRFKTGYKNNATVPRKSELEKRIQRYAVFVAAASAALWYFL